MDPEIAPHKRILAKTQWSRGFFAEEARTGGHPYTKKTTWIKTLCFSQKLTQNGLHSCIRSVKCKSPRKKAGEILSGSQQYRKQDDEINN